MIVVDVETTGEDPRTNSIVSIAAVDLHNPQRLFYEECRIDDDVKISPIALQVNGLTEQQLRDPGRKPAKEVMRSFLQWFLASPSQVIAGQNVYFDLAFIDALIAKHNLAEEFQILKVSPLTFFDIKQHFGSRTVDLHSISFAHHLQNNLPPPIQAGTSQLSADATLQYVGLPPEPKPHIAINGAKMEAEAFSRLIYGKLLFKEFEHYPLPDYLIK